MPRHTITDVTVTKKGRFALFVDGEFAFSVDDETFVQQHLQKGTTLEEEQLEEIREETQFRYAKQQALRLLSHKSYTFRMLTERLCTYEIPKDMAERATERMEELGLIDDADYALRFARDCVNLKNRSLSHTARELERRGVDADLITDALEQFSALDVQDKIAQIIKKKYWKDLDTPKGKARAINGLSRLGYPYGEVHTVVQHLLENPAYYNPEDTEV